MPNWLGPLLQALGLATPFIYAAGTYGFFLWLDKKASGEAKRTISSWFYWRPQATAVSKAVLEIFDRAYTSPLLGWRALVRSTTATLVFTAAFVIFVAHRDGRNPIESISFFSLQLTSNIISDYLSLFVIRYLLAIRSSRPVLISLAAPVVGMLLVAAASTLRFDVWFGLAPISFLGDGSVRAVFALDAMTVPAVGVHLWIPLFILAVFLVRAAGVLLWASAGMQWFLKRGGSHPLEALGLVAAPVVFVCAAIGQWLWH